MKKCSSNDTRHIHPYQKDFLDKFKTPVEIAYAKEGWKAWDEVVMKRGNVVSFKIITKNL